MVALGMAKLSMAFMYDPLLQQMQKSFNLFVSKEFFETCVWNIYVSKNY